jgi:broad specificity phosphatase PhoE
MLSKLIQQEFYFIRHGQTDWNLEERCMGHTDIPLNTHGINQAHAVKDLIKKYQINSICHSSLQRARQTATIIATHCNCQLYEIDELKEKGCGTFEGMLKPEIEKVRLQHNDLKYFPQDAETVLTFQERIIQGINKALQFPFPVLVVSHGGVCRALMAIMKFDAFVDLENCKIIKCIPNIKKWQIEFI